ncbi:MAG: hypothetical protein AUG00_02770 [Candidatus Rokubacteria bacterium 13_1_20CM_2_70_7]|nr:MAG: hypothetical protein AUG00_02770 [Candidatus Rokubacteria bacterium 13_1_20CM_2_70_7]
MRSDRASASAVSRVAQMVVTARSRCRRASSSRSVLRGRGSRCASGSLALVEDEVVRAAGGGGGQIQAPQHRLHPPVHLRRGEPHLAQAELDVLPDGDVRPQGALVKDVPDAALARRQVADVLGVHEHAPGRQRQEAGDRAQHRALARVRRAEEREELPVAHVDRDVLEIGLLPAARAQGIEPDVDERSAHINRRGPGRPPPRPPP